MNFESCGPFNLPRAREGRWRQEFWEAVEGYWEGLQYGIGCYAFCVNGGRRPKPWYVGKTLAQQGFTGEIFTPHKLLHYDTIMRGSGDFPARRGEPSIVLFPLVTDNWRLSSNRSSSAEYVDWLETTLIGMALSQNPEIANTSKTRFYKDVYVNGIIGGQYQGRPTSGATYAKRAFLGL